MTSVPFFLPERLEPGLANIEAAIDDSINASRHCGSERRPNAYTTLQTKETSPY